MPQESEVPAPETHEVRIEPRFYHVTRQSVSISFTGGSDLHNQISEWLTTNAWRIPDGDYVNLRLDCEVVQPLRAAIAPSPYPYFDFQTEQDEELH